MEIIPQLHERSQELPTIFRKIDQLEVCIYDLYILMFVLNSKALEYIFYGNRS